MDTSTAEAIARLDDPTLRRIAALDETDPDDPSAKLVARLVIIIDEFTADALRQAPSAQRGRLLRARGFTATADALGL
jgi:hypothetical protein